MKTCYASSDPQGPALNQVEQPLSDAEKNDAVERCSSIKPTANGNEGTSAAGEEPPYHVFSSRKKRLLVFVVAMAALFSPLSSNIYFPALDDIADVSSVPLNTSPGD